MRSVRGYYQFLDLDCWITDTALYRLEHGRRYELELRIFENGKVRVNVVDYDAAPKLTYDNMESFELDWRKLS